MPVATFTESYLDYASRRTSAPRRFHELSALAVCAAALGKRAYVNAAWGRVYPALWVGLIGPSRVHKSTAANLATKLLAIADPDVFLPQDFSREAMYETLEGHPYGLMEWQELGVQLESFNRDYNSGILSFLTQTWDSPPVITRKTKNAGLVRIEYPALSIIAAGKLRWLQENLSKRQVAGGWLGRWLFCVEHKNAGDYRSMFGDNGQTPEAAQHQRDSLIEHLRSLAQCPERVVEHGDGGPAIDEWAKSMDGKYDDTSDPAEFSERAATQVTKLALAIQATRGPTELWKLHPKAVEQAIILWEYCFGCGRYLVEALARHGRDSDEMQRILSFIKADGQITRRNLLRRADILKRHLDEYMETIIEKGLVVEQHVKNERARPTVWYTYKGPK